MTSPLTETPWFRLGPVPMSSSVLTSFGITCVLGIGGFLLTRRLSLTPSRRQVALETLVSTIDEQVREVVQADPAPYTPLIGTLFIYLVVANSVEVVPLLEPPTGRLETTLALALIVFFSVYVYGIRSHGFRGYLKHFVEPTPLLAPIHVLSELTRTFALMMRLFGNIMSHGLVLAIVVSLAGLFVPIPIMAFGLFVGFVQAYIFATLAAVYVAAAVESHGNKLGESDT